MTSPKGRILCTEDDADTRDLIIYVLSAEGYDVKCTDSAEQAISLVQNEDFDLFLFDTRLPGASGADLTRTLRTFDVKTPVLFYSAAAYNSDKENARAAGAQGYLVKPASGDDLITEVTRLIAESKVVPVKLVVP
jgi:two-component system, OmpR family, response regulator